MKQLHLSEQEFITIGFEKIVTPDDYDNQVNPCGSQTYYQIPFLNGVIYYFNEHWTFRCDLDKGAMHTPLDVTNLAMLYSAFQICKVKFNMILI